MDTRRIRNHQALDPLARRQRVVVKPRPVTLEMVAAATELDAITANWGCDTCSPEKCTHNRGDDDGME